MIKYIFLILAIMLPSVNYAHSDELYTVDAMNYSAKIDYGSLIKCLPEPDNPKINTITEVDGYFISEEGAGNDYLNARLRTVYVK